MKKLLMFSILVFSLLIPSFVYAEIPGNHILVVCSNGNDCGYESLDEALTYLDSIQPTPEEIEEGLPNFEIYIDDEQKQIIGSHHLKVPVVIHTEINNDGPNRLRIEGEAASVLTSDYPVVIECANVFLDSLTIHSNYVFNENEMEGALSLRASDATVTNLHLKNNNGLHCGDRSIGLLAFGNLTIEDSTIEEYDGGLISFFTLLGSTLLGDSGSTSEQVGFISKLGPALLIEEQRNVIINSCDLSNNSISLSASAANCVISNSKLSMILAPQIGFLSLKSDNHLGNLKVKTLSSDEMDSFDFCTNKGLYFINQIPSIEMAKDLVVDINKTKKIQNMIEYFRDDASNAIDFDYEVIYGEDSDVTKEYVKVTDGSVSILQPGTVTIKATRRDAPDGPVETYYLNLKIEKAIINPGTGTVLLIGFVILLVVSLVVITILTKRKKK